MHNCTFPCTAAVKAGTQTVRTDTKFPLKNAPHGMETKTAGHCARYADIQGTAAFLTDEHAGPTRLPVRC